MELKGHEELGHEYVSYIASAKIVLERVSAGIRREIELIVVSDLENLPDIVLDESTEEKNKDEKVCSAYKMAVYPP
jgi:hypothetical protein